MRSRMTGIVPAATLLAFSGVLILALAGCGTAQEVSVTQTDNGSAVTVPKNGTLQVSLYGNPSTGFGWVVVEDAGGILKQLGDPVVQAVKPNASASGPTVGMTERQTFQFDATKAGSGTLQMEYKRSWETTVPAEETFALDVTVE